jgi:rare lipoprotein A
LRPTSRTAYSLRPATQASKSNLAAVNAASTQTLNWYAQVGAFGEKANALRVKQNLDQAHLSGTAIVEERSGDRSLWKVRVGPVDSVGAYDQLVQQLHSVGINTITLVDGQRLGNRSPH